MYVLYRLVSSLNILSLTFLVFVNGTAVHVRASQLNEVTDINIALSAEIYRVASSASVTTPEAFRSRATELYPSFIPEGLRSPLPETSTLIANERESSNLFQEETGETNNISPSDSTYTSDLIISSLPYLARQSSYDPHITSMLSRQPLNAKVVSVPVTKTSEISGTISSFEGITVTTTVYHRSHPIMEDLNTFSSFEEEISGIDILTLSQQKLSEGISVMPTLTALFSNHSWSVKVRPVSSNTDRLLEANTHSHNDLLKLNYPYVKTTCISCYHALNHYSGSPQTQEGNKTGKTKEPVYVQSSTYHGLEDKLESHDSNELMLRTSVPRNIAHSVRYVEIQKAISVQNVSDILHLSSTKDFVAGSTVPVVTTVYPQNVSADENLTNVRGVNTPRKISYAATSTYHLVEDKPLGGNGSLKTLSHTGGAENEFGDLHCPVYFPETISHEFVMKFLVLKNTSVQHSLPKTFEVTLRKALNDSHCHSVVRMSFIDGQPFIFTWTNASVDSHSCPQTEISQIYQKMVTDKGVQSNFATAFHPDFEIVDIKVKNVGVCLPIKSNGVQVILGSLFSFVMVVIIVVALCIFTSRKNQLRKKHRDSFILRPRSPFIFADEMKSATFKEHDAQMNRNTSCDNHNSSGPNICLNVLQKSINRNISCDNHNSSDPNICIKVLQDKPKTFVEEISEQVSDINVCLNCEVQRPCGSHMCSTPKNV